MESILNRDGAGRVTVFSAGSQPAGKVHPQALRLLGDLGFPTAKLRSKSWDEFAGPDAPKMDAVITVCGNAADEVCPIWPGAPVQAHWGVGDPAAAAPEDWDAAFSNAFEQFSARAQAFLHIDFEGLDHAMLATELRRIGAL